MAAIDDVLAAKQELSSRLLRSPGRARALRVPVLRTMKNVGQGLHGVGVGLKLVNGKPTREVCVRLYVLNKLPEARLARAIRLPAKMDGVPTDVIEAPLPVFHATKCSAFRRKRLRPLIGGMSAAHELVYLATFGCFCRFADEKERDRVLMLGCNHAFGNLNSGALGSPIRQPSPGDGGSSVDRVARLVHRVPLQFGGAQPNVVDAAVAEVPPRSNIINEICTIGPLKGIMPATLGMTVRKHGRSSGYTEGTVVDVSLDEFVVEYLGGPAALFVNQLRIQPTPAYDTWPAVDGGFATDGDSGSIVVDKKSQHAVGLHFAGAYGVSIANPIKEVCVGLGITIP